MSTILQFYQVERYRMKEGKKKPTSRLPHTAVIILASPTAAAITGLISERFLATSERQEVTAEKLASWIITPILHTDASEALHDESGCDILLSSLSWSLFPQDVWTSKALDSKFHKVFHSGLVLARMFKVYGDQRLIRTINFSRCWRVLKWVFL